MANTTKKSTKVWSGRFESGPSELMEAFSRSIDVDRHMWQQDILVNKAWAEALCEIGIFTADEARSVQAGLDQIAAEFEHDAFEFLPDDEDIHVAIERRLTELTGEAGARIHTGRSRNDQVATDARLFLKQHVDVWCQKLAALQNSLIELAKANLGIVMPGYTHLQQAQPILLSHYLLAIFWGVDRTLSRLDDYFERLDVMPLGNGALAGAAFPVDRQKLAARLGFARISNNSIDTTGDRDFCAELLFIIGSFFSHVSRVCAELQWWSSNDIAFVEFSDQYATGSSMMPQKKNPDAMELIRGKSAAAIAAANQILILQKGLPLTYNRDLQEDKPVTFHQLREASISTEIFEQALKTASFNKDKMAAAIDPNTLATDAADYLVRKNVPFRQAHEIAGKLVRLAIERKVALSALSLQDFRSVSPVFDDDVFAALTVEASLAQRNIAGGTGPDAVKNQLAEASARAAKYDKNAFLR